jgi:biotin operon repressor
MKERIKNYLQNNCRGAAHSITSRELQFELGCDGQEIRTSVNELRCEGIPICSWGKGYYYAANTDDVDRTIAQLRGRIKKMNNAINGLLPQENKRVLRRSLLLEISCGYMVKAIKEKVKMKITVKEFEKFAKKYGYANGKQLMNELGCSDMEYKSIRSYGYIGCDWVCELYNRFGEDVLSEFLSFDEDRYE